ncbi:FAD-dependent oxidoreductase [Paracoccus sp. S-4012]|uniref:NAD(P)/FAD-dependent oxidoreductase n=1 Tax=Paracoccus sp. S-4012 TaxID=2665648 RepID=UPI0012AFCE33|nr:FAD-binding oxidoreductase [Paracoccus sp. S-4012]MRX51705.1 FAD-dependent oxidoreductase [Paracoccus sp. S-4012]
MVNHAPAPQDIAVIGAGLVGSACALALAEDGHRVTLFDPDPPGAGTSSGNAGGIVTGAVVPTATSQVLRALPSYVLDRNGPAVLRLRHALHALPWLWRFVRAGRPAEVARIAAALWPLVEGSLTAHRQLARLAGADGMITDEGWLKVYASDAEFAATAPDRLLMDRCGVRYQVLDQAEVMALEPGLNPDLARIGMHQPESGFVRDPRGLAQSYADAALSRGARHLCQRVRGLVRRPGGVTIHADAGPQDFDRLVIAAGAWSATLARQLGDRVSLDTERGYHLGFGAQTAGLLRRPVGLPALGMVLSPMQGGLRLVSGDELAGLTAPPDFRRIRGLVPQARRAVPGLSEQPVTSEWMGFRPSTPDSLPVIGVSPHGPEVIHAFGHGHLGLTLAAITALMVADAVAGRPPRVEPRPYVIGRFR